VHVISAEIAGMHENLRTITFFYSFTLMLKFFKAFRANPRLNIVIMTIQVAAIDIIHFFIVFITIFLVFSMMAAIVFGPKIKEFHTQIRAFFYCWRILLGDFDVEEMEQVDYKFANLWFLGFQIMVMMILLNMLLAIIMDTYSGVVGKGGNKTIWDQTAEAVKTVRLTRGHLPLLYIRCEMEDEDQKAHPGERVNSKSLRKAFERDKMTRANADYLVMKTIEFCQEREEECDLKIHDAVKLVGQTKTMVLKISQDTSKTLDFLIKAERAPTDARHDAIMAGYDPDDPKMMAKLKAAQLEDSHAPPVMATGVPNNGPGPGAPMNNMSMGNMNNMHGGIWDAEHPFGMDDIHAGAQMPFLAANAQNTLAHGNSFSTTMPMQMSNNQYNSSGGMMSNDFTHSSNFNTTGISMANSTMSSTGGGAQPMNNQQSNQQSMQMQSMQQQRGMGMSGGGGNGNEKIQAQLAQMMEMMVDQRNYIEQRDAWLETRMGQLDRRCQKVEVLSDRLNTVLGSFDINDIAAVPRDVTKALNLHFQKMDGGGHDGIPSKAMPPLRDTSSFVDRPPTPAGEPPDIFQGESSSIISNTGDVQPQMAHSAVHALHNEVRSISTHMETLLSHAEATPQITRLLWRMDLNLRQLTGTASNLPVQQVQAVVPAAGPSAPLGTSSTQQSAGRNRSNKAAMIGGSRPRTAPGGQR